MGESVLRERLAEALDRALELNGGELEPSMTIYNAEGLAVLCAHALASVPADKQEALLAEVAEHMGLEMEPMEPAGWPQGVRWFRLVPAEASTGPEPVTPAEERVEVKAARLRREASTEPGGER